MNKRELQRMLLVSQLDRAQQEVTQWLSAIRDEAARKLEPGQVVSTSAFFDLSQKLADAVSQQAIVEAQIQLLGALEE